MTVLEIIERETGQSVTAETPLDSLNLDSLEFMNLLLEIDKETGIVIRDDKIGDLHTVGDILAC